MPVSLGQRGQPGFDQPLELMSDCHRRIEAFLAVFTRVLGRYATRDLDDEATNALQAAQRYFREGAPRHTQDEEQSLFPRLRGLKRDELRDLLDAADRLEQDHQHAEKLHASVDAQVERWLDTGRITPEQSDALTRDLDALNQLYTNHIEFEDKTLFPAASRALAADDLRDIGREMAARRGRDFNATAATTTPTDQSHDL